MKSLSLVLVYYLISSTIGLTLLLCFWYYILAITFILTIDFRLVYSLLVITLGFILLYQLLYTILSIIQLLVSILRPINGYYIRYYSVLGYYQYSALLYIDPVIIKISMFGLNTSINDRPAIKPKY